MKAFGLARIGRDVETPYDARRGAGCQSVAGVLAHGTVKGEKLTQWVDAALWVSVRNLSRRTC